MPIANHQAPRLSKLDLEIMSHVPPGGNWRHVPKGMSRRIDKMEGGRSTQYGRLLPGQPSYTIPTYYPRPGNGCHFHWSQERTISHREAARLQSFPDAVGFGGTQREVAVQIGNAVPPLLAYQLAKVAGDPGTVCDLFCGAGGLTMGFSWAGWRPGLCVDLMGACFVALGWGVHGSPWVMPCMDIAKRYDEVLEAAREVVAKGPRPIVVLGGPPCQGHSTAGTRGGLDDPRNQLIRTYLRFVEDVRPDGFLMENVMGLRTSAGGGFLKEVLDKTAELGYEVACHDLDASRYAIPQRRKRVFACGFLGRAWPKPPEPFSLESKVSVSDALGDLPPLKAGEDGVQLDYTGPAFTPYQAFCRGEIDAGGYLDAIGFGPCL